MGSKSSENLVTFGDVYFSNTDKTKVILPCSFTELCEFDMIVHDRQGRAVISKTVEATEKTKEVSLDISKLEAGHYHIWLYLKDGTVIRDFHIVGNEKDTTGIIGKLTNLFKRFNMVILTTTVALETPLCFLQPVIEG